MQWQRVFLVSTVILLVSCSSAPTRQDTGNVLDLYGVNPEMRELLENLQQAEVELIHTRNQLLTTCEAVEEVAESKEQLGNTNEAQSLYTNVIMAKFELAIDYPHAIGELQFMMFSLLLCAKEGLPPTQTQKVSAAETIEKTQTCTQKLAGLNTALATSIDEPLYAIEPESH